MEYKRYDLRSEKQKIKDVEPNNRFRLKVIKTKKVIALKKIKDKILLMFLIKKENIDIYNINNIIDNNLINYLTKRNIINDTRILDSIIYTGDLTKIDYTNLVYRYPIRKQDIKNNKLQVNIFYRDYSKTKNEQEEIMWLVNTAPNEEDSWKSALNTLTLNKDKLTGMIILVKDIKDNGNTL